MKKLSVTILIALIFFCGFLLSCKNDKAELLYPPQPCDTTNVRYSTTIIGILRDNCYRCHAGSSTVGPFNLDSYADVKVRAASGELWGAVSHAPGFSPMPKGTAQLSACDLAKIKKWLDDGYPNN